MTIQEVLNAVAVMDRHGLDRVARVVATRWKQLQLLAAMELSPGDRVEFTSSKDGRTVHGEVQRVGDRKVTVLEDGGRVRWRVSPTLLRRA